jgi:MFS transporter, PAT family, beta-lactamase induction signal transducer AmpG
VPNSSFLKALAVYTDRRVLTILFLGFSSGLPLALTGSTLSRWLSEGSVDRATIGLFALVSMPYALKFCWAPLIDKVVLPVLGRRFGQRRSWALVTQVALAAAILGLGTTDPVANLWWTAFLSVVVAFCSASQDIVIDAYRVEFLDENQQAAGSAIYVLGYRFGMLASGAGALYLAEVFSWQAAYAAMGVAVAVGFLTVLLSAEPRSIPPADAQERQRRVERWLAARPHLTGWRADLLGWLYAAVVAPFAQFMKRDAWIAALLFIACYKAADVIAGQMTQPFYFELGFTKGEVASITKVFGLWAMIIGGLLGGILVERLGVLRGLMLGGVLQMVSNLGFVALAHFGHDLSALACVVAVENVCGGIATAAFVAYLSGLCDASYTATQYALLSSFYKIGGDLVGASSGMAVNALGWMPFFLFSMAAALPALAILAWLLARGQGRPAVAETGSA